MSTAGRVSDPRQSTGPLSPSDMCLPFSFIQKQFGYPVESIVKQIHCEPVVHLGVYPNTFPNTIQEYYWISTSGSSWMALGRLKNGLYFFYSASTDATGTFKNGGGSMCLWLAVEYSNLIHFAMDQTTYDNYYSQTRPMVP